VPTFRHPDKIDKIRNPSEEQLRDAEKHGIDLKDPMVVAELERLQTEADGDVGSDLYCQQKGTIFPTASFHHFPLKASIFLETFPLERERRYPTLRLL
jgi:hypothetical protein